MEKRVVCVFDLDHTLVRVNSSFHFGLYLYRKKVISLKQALLLGLIYFRHKFLGMGVKKLHQEIFSRLFLGKKASLFQELLEDFLDTSLDDIVYVPGYRRLIEAQKMGHTTMIVSSSPGFIVEGIAYRFTVDSWRATKYKTERGLFTSVAQVVTGSEKAKVVQELQQSFDEVWGFSDSILDLPFLEAVTRPFVVKPDSKLRRHAKREKWEIVQ